MKGKEEKNKEKNTLEIKLKKNLEINNEEGLKVTYNKSDLKAQFPQLMHELSVKKKKLSRSKELMMISSRNKQRLKSIQKNPIARI